MYRSVPVPFLFRSRFVTVPFRPISSCSVPSDNSFPSSPVRFPSPFVPSHPVPSLPIPFHPFPSLPIPVPSPSHLEPWRRPSAPGRRHLGQTCSASALSARREAYSYHVQAGFQSCFEAVSETGSCPGPRQRPETELSRIRCLYHNTAATAADSAADNDGDDGDGASYPVGRLNDADLRYRETDDGVTERRWHWLSRTSAAVGNPNGGGTGAIVPIPYSYTCCFMKSLGLVIPYLHFNVSGVS